MAVARVEREIGGRTLSIETGRLAKQAGGTAVVQYGDTVVQVTATSAEPREGIDFFPLTVEYREYTYAAGKIPGGFFKREGRPSAKETLTCRMIDRPLRPLFPEGYKDEVQIVALVLSADQQNDPDLLAMIGASAALGLAPIPWNGPIGCVRIGLADGEFVVNPTHDQRQDAEMDLTLATVEDRVAMMELEGNEVPEDRVAEALEFAMGAAATIVEMQHELVEAYGAKEPTWEPPRDTAELEAAIEKEGLDDLRAAKRIPGKQDRSQASREVADRVREAILGPDPEEAEWTPAEFKRAWEKVEERLVTDMALAGERTDGRAPDQLRPIACEVGVLPRTHGSALFTRGETQALVVTTLGTVEDQQIIDGLLEEYRKPFMLHYNFPPFSVGEVKMMRGPRRRDIGHGALAEKSIGCVMPGPDEFPYTCRIVSDIMESNGSSSMATVCGATLSLMDAGVPISNPVAGISIGRCHKGDQEVFLVDIQGEEDHAGDMDFKIAGTQKGITGIQLDLKVRGVTLETCRKTLEKSREVRLEILRTMLQTIERPRPEISRHAPRLIQIRIDPDKIGRLIGPGGKTIKGIEADTGARVEVEDDGTVTVSSVDADAADKAREIVESLTEEVKVGKIYTGKVVSIKPFGAFIEILPSQDGMCHISELADNYVDKVEDVLNMGDMVRVKVINVDDQGRVKLSRKAALREEEGSPAETS
jgi:polyribonucleotide nucleotidyltransferase